MGRALKFMFFGLYLAAFIFFILAFSCPFWFERGNESSGLFKECYRPSYGMDWICTYLDYSKAPGAEIGTMVMMVLALLVNIATFFLTIMAIFKEFPNCVTIGGILCGVGAILELLAIGIFGSTFDGDTERIGWAFAVACISMGIQAGTSITVVVAERLNC